MAGLSLWRCRSTTTDAWATSRHHLAMTRRFVRLSFGAGLGAFLVLLAEATAGRRFWVGCPSDFDSPPCVPPALWSWAKISAMYVTIGAIVGAALACLLTVLVQRAHQRRREWGEL